MRKRKASERSRAGAGSSACVQERAEQQANGEEDQAGDEDPGWEKDGQGQAAEKAGGGNGWWDESSALVETQGGEIGDRVVEEDGEGSE